MRNLVILGAGTAGTMMAARMRQRLQDGWQITVVDQDDVHVYQPGLLFLPFGWYRLDEIVKPRSATMPQGVNFVVAHIDRVDTSARKVLLHGGTTLDYDVLVVATGTRLLPGQTPGLTGPGWRVKQHEFYSIEGALALGKALDSFEGGRVVVNFVEMPIKCPVAPLEMVFLLEAHFRKKGIREKVQLTYATPLAGAFTKPRATAVLGGLMEERGIAVEPNFALDTVDGEKGQMTAYDGRTLDFDLLVTVPLHGGAEFVAASGMGDSMGFVPTDKRTLAARDLPGVFVIGDATDVPTSKAGSVAHFEAEVLTDNILRYLAGEPLRPDFDGHANCFIETGDGKAMLIDFNYETEPLPGRFPLPGAGPFALLEETHINHWGKLGFKWVYWNLLLTGQDLPIDHRMVMAGKWSVA